MTSDLPKSTTWEDVSKALSLTIKRDDPSKLITFAALALTKTEDDQINLGFQAESAAGKTYIAREVASYFPQEDIMEIAGASPTAFIHEYGEWDDERKIMRIDLEGKVLIFLDFPDYRLIEKMRTLLSHDSPVLTWKFTDKNERSGLRTKTVEIVGFPTVIFCSTSLNLDDQEKTRLLLLSPGVDQAKLKESVKLTALKASDKSRYYETVRSDPRRSWLEALARKVWSSGVKRIRIEADLYEELVKRRGSGKLRPRDQRDVPRIASLIKAHALLNVDLRARDKNGTLIASDEDIKAGFWLYDRVSMANELGLSPYVMRLFEDVLAPLFSKFVEGVPRKEIYQTHYSQYGRMANQQWYEKEIFPAWEAAGLIVQEQDPNDKRRKLVYSSDGHPPDQTIVFSEFGSFWRDIEGQDNNSTVQGVGRASEGEHG